MSFIDADDVDALKTLKSAHYNFPRAEKLRQDMKWMITDYYAKSSLDQPFEARGLVVTGPSRIGKSKEIRRLLTEVNDGSTILPDGRPAKIVTVVLKGLLTWKDLGIHTLTEGLKYPAEGRMTQREVWERVVWQAREQGVVGIHYDECQHVFPKVVSESRAMILDSFKSLLKQPEWPLMLILSVINTLMDYINSEEQLAYLLRPVKFREISTRAPNDLQEINNICHAYAAKVELDVSKLASRDFYQRLCCACANRWGLVIEMIIDALIIATQRGDGFVETADFCQAFTHKAGLGAGYSPFSIDEYQSLFQETQIFDLLSKK
ncbi:MAG: ATP-binding protein [Nereida ignava]